MADNTKKTAPIPESLWKQVCDEAKKEFRTPEQHLAWIVDQYFRRGVCGGTVGWNVTIGSAQPRNKHNNLDQQWPWWEWSQTPSPFLTMSNTTASTCEKGL